MPRPRPLRFSALVTDAACAYRRLRIPICTPPTVVAAVPILPTAVAASVLCVRDRMTTATMETSPVTTVAHVSHTGLGSSVVVVVRSRGVTRLVLPTAGWTTSTTREGDLPAASRPKQGPQRSPFVVSQKGVLVTTPYWAHGGIRGAAKRVGRARHAESAAQMLRVLAPSGTVLIDPLPTHDVQENAQVRWLTGFPLDSVALWSKSHALRSSRHTCAQRCDLHGRVHGRGWIDAWSGL